MNDSPESTPKTESTEHAYDSPTITATKFLEAVYRDPTIKLRHRVNAAYKLLRILHKDPEYVAREIAMSREPDLIYQIGGIKLQ